MGKSSFRNLAYYYLAFVSESNQPWQELCEDIEKIANKSDDDERGRLSSKLNIPERMKRLHESEE